MPYSPHDQMDEPSDPDARLWRYMDVAKLVSILVGRALFFPSGTNLTEQDKFEGQPTYAEISEVNQLAVRPPPEELPTYLDEVFANFREEAANDQKRIMATVESIAFFNCWHMNDDESDAMWKIYDTGKRGVAIRSTVDRLKRSFNATDKTIDMGKVRYYTEPDNTPPDTAIYIWRFMRKRKAFEHERELRAVSIDAERRGQAGIAVPIILEELIMNIVISPYADSWIEPLVKEFVCRLGYKFDVIPSDAARQLPSTLLGAASNAL